MATPQGNFVAYQPLKPTELKVGDIFAEKIDYLIKQKRADDAAKLKAAQEAGKSLKDLVKDVKVEHKTTITPIQNEYNKMVSEGINYISQANMMAENMSIPLEERQKYVMRAINYARDVNELSTFLNDPKLIESYDKNLQKIRENKHFEGDSRIGLFTSVDAGIVKMRRNEDGNIEVGYVSDINDTPEKAIKWEPISQVKQKYMTDIETNTQPEYIKRLVEIAQKVTTETTNSNGYVKTYKKKFDSKDGRSFLLNSFGYNPDVPDDEIFSVNAVPRELNHLFYSRNKRNIETKEDFTNAINTSLEIMRASADEKTSNEVLKTADEIEATRLRNIRLRQEIADNNRPKSSGGGSGIGKEKAPAFSFVEGGTVLQKLNQNSTMEVGNATIVNLGNKEYIAGYKVPNKNGKGFHTEYAIIGSDEYGRQAFEKMTTRSDAFKRMTGYNLDPIIVESKILSGNTVTNKNFNKNNKIGVIKYDASHKQTE